MIKLILFAALLSILRAAAAAGQEPDAAAAGQELDILLTGCLSNGQLRHLKLGDEPTRKCGKRETEVTVPLAPGLPFELRDANGVAFGKVVQIGARFVQPFEPFDFEVQQPSSVMAVVPFVSPSTDETFNTLMEAFPHAMIARISREHFVMFTEPDCQGQAYITVLEPAFMAPAFDRPYLTIPIVNTNCAALWAGIPGTELGVETSSRLSRTLGEE